MRLSLRTRVLAATLVLMTAGLAVAGVVTYAFLKSFLLHRVDQQLVDAEFPATNALKETLNFGHPDQGGPQGLTPTGTYCAFLDSSGKTLVHAPLGPYTGTPAAPRLPAGLPGSSNSRSTDAHYFTTGSSGPSYRVLATAATETPSNVQGTLVIAIPLTDVSGTLHRLVWVEIAVAAGVLVAVGGAGWFLVRRGLRPLDAIAETAGAIAAGDLSQRVPDAEESTEVGRLGLALNAMLGQIEGAFAERTASEERLRRFVADASHELRTPLTSIRGYSELFHRGAADRPEDLAKAMERIEAEASRMGVLVDDLLLLARLDQGAPLVRDRVDLAGVASRSVQDARAADPSRSISLHGDGPVMVEGDEGRLKQVLDNLLANARIHTPPGTPTRVTVSSDGRAVVDVADEGPGVPPGVAGRIFERFYRSDASRSRERGGGAGLGLAIASEIARAHGGELSLLQSDRGAAFRLSLPLVPS